MNLSLSHALLFLLMFHPFPCYALDVQEGRLTLTWDPVVTDEQLLPINTADLKYVVYSHMTSMEDMAPEQAISSGAQQSTLFSRNDTGDHYHSLGPGTYYFRVTAINENGESKFGLAPNEINVRIIPKENPPQPIADTGNSKKRDRVVVIASQSITPDNIVDVSCENAAQLLIRNRHGQAFSAVGCINDRARWDGRNEDGEVVASGVYLLGSYKVVVRK